MEHIETLMSFLYSLLPLVAVLAVFYFLLIRPQKKQEEAIKKMINNIKEGNNIFTSSGIIGKVISVYENELVIKSEESTIKILKSSVVYVENGDKNDSK